MTTPETTSQKPSTYEVGNIGTEKEAQSRRGWKVEINGREVEDPVASLRLIQPKMGVEIKYGQRPEGYDGPVIEEPGGGGSVIVPYIIHEGQLYIAVVEEKRPTVTDGNSEQTVLNVPRGFLEPGQTHFETAKRELTEETGYIPLDQRIKEIEGDPMNPNSTFFVTGTGKGVKVFSAEVGKEEVRRSKEAANPLDLEFEFNPDVIKAKPESKTAERVMKSRFIHWTKAVRLQDMFTSAAVARLFLEQQKNVKLF